MPAPIALFVYNRLWHTQQTVESLARNALADQSELIIYADGPKTEKDRKPVKEVREYLKSIKGFKTVEIVESHSNKGLANSIISGVSQVLTKHDSIVVMEDDMITSPHFLTYINNSLELYKNDEDVISIHGYIYPVREKLPETFFLKGADCWGWATWRRGWRLFNADGKYLLRQLKQRKRTAEFDFDGSYSYTRMLRNQIRGLNNSWAIRWYASAFLLDKLTLYPGNSLVHNIGNDSSGTHSLTSTKFDHAALTDSIDLQRIAIQEDKNAKLIISKYLKSTREPLYRKIVLKLRFWLR